MRFIRLPWIHKKSDPVRAGVGHVVVMYTRAEGCDLCEETYGVLESAERRDGFELRVVAVDGDPKLERRYGYRVPVVSIDGEEAFNYRVDPAQLRKRLQKVFARPK